MRLEELLNQITSLPWHLTTMPDTGEPASAVLGANGIRIAQVDTVPGMTLANRAYLIHAANVLPELLAAAKNLRDNWERNLTEPLARLNDAIELAEDVAVARGRAQRWRISLNEHD